MFIYEKEKLDCMCGYGYGIRFLFSHTRIGLLIETGRETVKQ